MNHIPDTSKIVEQPSKDIMETDERKAIFITPSTHKLLKILAKKNKRSMGLQLEVMLKSITNYHKEILDTLKSRGIEL